MISRDSNPFKQMPPEHGITLCQVFEIPLWVEWREGRIVRTQWWIEKFSPIPQKQGIPTGETLPIDPFTQHLVELSLVNPQSIYPWLARQGSQFSLQMRELLLTIQPGSTLTYGQLAARMGSRGARGVAQSLSRNQIPWFVPCHRITGSRGNLGGYTVGGCSQQEGIAIKQRLLLQEKCYISEARY